MAQAHGKMWARITRSTELSGLDPFQWLGQLYLAPSYAFCFCSGFSGPLSPFLAGIWRLDVRPRLLCDPLFPVLGKGKLCWGTVFPLSFLLKGQAWPGSPPPLFDHSSCFPFCLRCLHRIWLPSHVYANSFFCSLRDRDTSWTLVIGHYGNYMKAMGTFCMNCQSS